MGYFEEIPQDLKKLKLPCGEFSLDDGILYWVNTWNDFSQVAEKEILIYTQSLVNKVIAKLPKAYKAVDVYCEFDYAIFYVELKNET
jgi:hypothetical protein